MATPQGNQIIILNDFVTLPIIISDYDAAAEDEQQSSRPSTSNSSTTSPSSDASGTPQWATGFNVFTDKLWEKMTLEVKEKLRQACVEVLKRTDAAEDSRTKVSWQYDDDARFLD